MSNECQIESNFIQNNTNSFVLYYRTIEFVIFVFLTHSNGKQKIALAKLPLQCGYNNALDRSSKAI